MPGGSALVRFEFNIGRRVLAALNPDLHRLRPEPLVPRLQRVRALRDVAERERPVRAGDGEVGPVRNATISSLGSNLRSSVHRLGPVCNAAA